MVREVSLVQEQDTKKDTTFFGDLSVLKKVTPATFCDSSISNLSVQYSANFGEFHDQHAAPEMIKSLKKVLHNKRKAVVSGAAAISVALLFLWLSVAPEVCHFLITFSYSFKNIF